ncbi:MAG TPA: DcaP family trimeric outer membrane transporter [Vicinamibacterales bacterium]|nr:DcaP family trimeric outer membrane transporter [Vicinamibacterales bacterium]
MQIVAVFVVLLAAAALPSSAGAQPPDEKPTLDIYGFAQVDAIADFNQNNPDWYDVLRPSKLPAFTNQFGEDGRFYMSPRQSRFGVRGTLPTSDGDIKATFEFDMFGVGVDAGQTTIRLRHAWGQWKQFGGGQTNGQFTDTDIFPNSLDYWGPNGMLFFRNVQVFWEPFNDGTSNARIAIEKPGASADLGVVSDRIELQNVKARFPVPDFTGHYRRGASWGYVQVGGALRYMGYDDLLPNDQFALSGHNWGWGISVSSNLKVTPYDTLKLGIVEGAGVENYFNDAPVDVGVKSNPGNAVTPVVGESLGDFGLVLFLDHSWNDRFTSAVGYSRVDISNSNGQAPNAFKNGQYALANLLCTPARNVMMGGEFQWIHRENFSDGFSVSDFRLQFSLKYSFGVKVGG